MCGSRKFALEHITRDDISALTHDASQISGVPYIMDVDKEEAWNIINGWSHWSLDFKKWKAEIRKFFGLHFLNYFTLNVL